MQHFFQLGVELSQRNIEAFYRLKNNGTIVKLSNRKD